MMSPDADFLQQLLAAFRVEAEEHLQAMSAGLIEIEKTPDAENRLPLIESVYREAHSLKGAARAVNLTDIERTCQAIETVFASWKRGEEHPTADALDGTHRSLDRLRALLTGSDDRPEQPAPQDETIRMATSKVDRLLREAEEMLAVKLAIRQRANELRDLASVFESWKKEWTTIQPQIRSLRQSVEREAAPPLPDASRLIEFCDLNLGKLRSIETRIESLSRSAQQDHHDVSRMVDDLLEDSKRLLMLPFSTMIGILPKLVRDLCRDQEKEAEMVMRGTEAEIDKRILDEMKDPLVHLIRNCVDHGLEAPSDRLRNGKPSRGTISVTVSEVEGNKIEIVVADDGAGIDPAKVRDSALKHGIISAEEASQINDDAAVALIFQSEVSTSNTVTAISGRGLGLAIVREKVEKLGGRVSVENNPGLGAVFRILLPVTLATFHGVLVEVAGQIFLIPSASVQHVALISVNHIKTSANRESVWINGRRFPLVRMEHVLELKRTTQPPDTLVAAVLTASGKDVAFAVDAVINETEVLAKPLRKPLIRVRNVAGATILGSGEVVLVLNVTDLVKSSASPGSRSPATLVTTGKKRKTVLVVENSITSRILLKNILESAGYKAKTAVDGIDALATLNTEKFDAVVSDIEMPRLNGFGLTESIRRDKKFAALPVILVTALESVADRQRGSEVGANAYLVKSSFDQSDLLETLQRFL